MFQKFITSLTIAPKVQLYNFPPKFCEGTNHAPFNFVTSEPAYNKGSRNTFQTNQFYF